jgi:hypothetical protein
MTAKREAHVVRQMLDWTFRDRRTGGITVAQRPNVSLSLFVVATIVLRLLHPSGRAENVVKVIADASLVIWALDELLRGVNPFRRALGAAILVAVIAGLALH